MWTVLEFRIVLQVKLYERRFTNKISKQLATAIKQQKPPPLCGGMEVLYEGF